MKDVLELALFLAAVFIGVSFGNQLLAFLLRRPTTGTTPA